jgi:mRNA interferase YafQ
MRKIEWTNAFKQDFKREKKGQLGNRLDGLLEPVTAALAADQALPEAKNDHPLSGEWKNYRECHLKPNLLLIYRKPDMETLQLVRLGSHSELFG